MKFFLDCVKINSINYPLNKDLPLK